MRVLVIVCTTTMFTIGFAGCGQPESSVPVSKLNDLVGVELAHVDPEVRAFLSRKQRAVRDLPDSSRAVGELAMAYEMNGFADSALVGYRRASSLAPTDIRWPYFEGLVLASFGEYEDALAALKQALVIDASYAPGWIWKGRWHLELNELDDAANAFTRALDLEANSAATVGLAQVALRKDKADVALSLLHELVQHDSHPQIVRLITNAQIRLGATAAETLPKSTQMLGQVGFPDPLSAEKRAYEVSISAELTRFRNLLAQPNDRNAAFKLIDSLYEKHPDNTRVVIAKAHRLRLEGDTTTLRTLLEQAHLKWPTEVNFTLGLAELETDLQNSTEALRLADEALAIEPDNTWGLLQKGIALAQQGRFAEAIDSFHRVLTIEETADIHYYLGNAFAELDDFTNARCHMHRAVELAPEFAVAKLQLKRLEEITQVDSQSDSDLESCLSRAAN